MLEREDIERLLAELSPAWKSQDESSVLEWLKREQISEEFWMGIARQLLSIVAEGVEKALEEKDHEMMSGSVMAGFQLAFFLGWESSKQYAPKRDMSRGLEEE